MKIILPVGGVTARSRTGLGMVGGCMDLQDDGGSRRRLISRLELAVSAVGTIGAFGSFSG